MHTSKFYIKLMKGKAVRKHNLHGKTAASVLLKTAIPRFGSRIRIRIRIRVRKISMLTPHSMFQYLANVSSYFDLTFNCQHIYIIIYKVI